MCANVINVCFYCTQLLESSKLGLFKFFLQCARSVLPQLTIFFLLSLSLSCAFHNEIFHSKSVSISCILGFLALLHAFLASISSTFKSVHSSHLLFATFLSISSCLDYLVFMYLIKAFP